MPDSVKKHKEFPSTAQFLTEGGDDRIRLDKPGGVNKYGCSPYPDANLIALGSSTATTVSAAGFAAADALREKLARAGDRPGDRRYAQEYERLRQELKTLFGLADLPGADIVFAASGTDAHLIAAQLIDHAAAMPLCAVMVDTAETGSGVAAALAGRHFSSRTALGVTVTENALLTERSVAVRVAAIRDANGYPRSAEAIDNDITGIVASAIAGGQRVLLTLTDVSKTGLIAPSPACAARLLRMYAGRLTVLVDACQCRIVPATLRAYLDCGYMVAITGSKFMTGPSFSGALFLPASIPSGELPLALLDYSARTEWPEQRQHGDLSDVANCGLLLRWEAALAEMRTFYALPEWRVQAFMQKCADAISHRLQNDDTFQLLPTQPLNRYPLPVEESWDTVPSIFSFLLYRSASNPHLPRVPLNREETARIYLDLQRDMSTDKTLRQGDAEAELAARRFQLGQPVLCGSGHDIPVSALRLCVSARMVAAALSPSGIGESGVIAQALAALDKIAWLTGALR
ncbi:MAG TPA: hypothetical protein VFN66_10520 [Burkholderiales bacterium]|nr:hypothetical protein [Burkholderiales bacterium]